MTEFCSARADYEAESYKKIAQHASWIMNCWTEETITANKLLGIKELKKEVEMVPSKFKGMSRFDAMRLEAKERSAPENLFL